MRIETLAPGAYAFSSSIRLAPGFILPLRSTALCRSDGGVVLVGPTSFDARALDFIDELGPVRALVAPNRLHHLSLAAASARWPDARVYAPAGLATKLAGVRLDETLSETRRQLGAELTLVGIDGAPALAEFAVFHGPSRTLVVTDLVFNVAEPTGWLTPLVLRAVGAHRRLAQGRELRWMVKDRGAAQASARRLLALGFERLVMAHGDVIDRDAPSQLEAALAWMLAGASR